MKKRQFYAPHTRTHTRFKKKKNTSTQSSNKLRYIKPQSPTLFLFILIPQSSSFNLGAPCKVNKKNYEYKSRPAGHTPAARNAHQTREKRTRSSHQQRSNYKKKHTDSKNESTEGWVIGDVDLPRGHQSCLRFPVTKPGHV